MLICQYKDVKIYETNNLLLVLKGDEIENVVYVEDKALIEDTMLEIKENTLRTSTYMKKSNVAVAR